MKTLKDILKELNIYVEEDLKKYIDDYPNNDNRPLKIVTRNDLKVDPENRIFDKEISYKNTIFDIDELSILNSDKVFFQDCIFMGRLRVANKNENAPTEVFFDTVSFKKELYISGSCIISKCTISDITSPALYIINNDMISNLDISRSNIGVLVFYNHNSNRLYCIYNTIEYFEFSESIIDEVFFPNNQININNYQAKSLNKKVENKIRDKHNYLFFDNSLNYKNSSENEKLKKINETSKFLLKSSDYHLDRHEFARLKYIAGLSSISSPYKRIFYQVFGGLIIPYRMVLLMVITIFIFSILYFFSGLNFSVSNTIKNLSFGEAIYFSGISFTTIGYGDVCPLNFVRYIAIFEGILGILLSSAFLISLTRKYIE